ncbi:reverse transcriptase domain-containing protein [Tanacetum coccineum]
MKATPRKLAYADSDKEASAGSLAKGFSNQFSLDPPASRQNHSPANMHCAVKSRRRHLPRKKDQRQLHKQTLGGAARNWFDDMDPKSVDSFDELSQKFLEEFSQQKRYAKDPTEIHGIKRRQNEGLQAFMDRFKSESSHIKGVPPVLRIFAFINGHGHSELAKKLNDKIPETVDEMFKRVRAFIRGEVATGSAEMVRPSQMDKGCIRPAWTGGPERARNRGSPREA